MLRDYAGPVSPALALTVSKVAAVQDWPDPNGQEPGNLFRDHRGAVKLADVIRVTGDAAWAALLGPALETLPSRFPDGYLALLLGPGLRENLVRDEIAAILRGQVREDGFTVRTEYPEPEPMGDKPENHDLAVLDNTGVAVLELEAKALYSFDALVEGRRRDARGGMLQPTHRLTRHREAVERLGPAAARGETCFVLSLVTHIMGHARPGRFTYADVHNRELARHASAEAMHQAAAERWDADLPGACGPVACHRPLPLGDAYEVPIWLDYYLIGPLLAAEAR